MLSNYVKHGNISHFQNRQVYYIMSCHIFSFLSLIKNSAIGVYLCPQVLKIRSKRALNPERFRFYFLISDKKQSVCYITRHIKLVYFENQKFYLPFYSIARFYEMKLGNTPKREVGVINRIIVGF